MRDVNSHDPAGTENQDVKLNLEKQVAAGVWIQVIGQLVEVISLSKLLLLSENVPSDSEKKAFYGVCIQAIGQLLEAAGVSQQLSTTNVESLIEGQEITITGDWLQAIGAAVEATGAAGILKEEIENIENVRGFIP
ncbi:MAG TPA: hypothetical protein VNM45_15615 [Bacillus sp. (in: firmicutes)]|nr:hypothetical protein [Bacillus sp. (in: firmicutes)]